MFQDMFAVHGRDTSHLEATQEIVFNLIWEFNCFTSSSQRDRAHCYQSLFEKMWEITLRNTFLIGILLLVGAQYFLPSHLHRVENVTSNGWLKCLLLGTKHTKAMLFCLQSRITFSEKCEAKLSPVSTISPVSVWACDINTLPNQSSNEGISNQPLFVDV